MLERFKLGKGTGVLWSSLFRGRYTTLTMNIHMQLTTNRFVDMVILRHEFIQLILQASMYKVHKAS